MGARGIHLGATRALGWNAENYYAAGVEIRAPYPAWLQRVQLRLPVGEKTDFLIPKSGCKLPHLLGDKKAPLRGAGLPHEFSHPAD